jgi:hypothetical protein
MIIPACECGALEHVGSHEAALERAQYPTMAVVVTNVGNRAIDEFMRLLDTQEAYVLPREYDIEYLGECQPCR